MAKNKKQRSNYEKFADANKRIRESNLAPDPYKELGNHGVPGKAVKKTAEILSEEALHEASYVATGIIYNPEKHSPYIGSVLYTVFKWLFLFLMSIFTLVKFFFLILGTILKFIKR